MSKKILILACLVLVCLAGSASADPNLFWKNPGFEDTNMSGFTVNGAGSGRSTSAHTGTYSYYVAGVISPPDIYLPVGYIYRSATMVSGGRIGCWAYSPGSGTKQVVVYEGSRSSGNVVYSATINGTWTQYEYTTTGSGTYIIEVYVGTSSVGTITGYADDFYAINDVSASASLNWTAPSYSANQLANVQWSISNYNASRSYRIDITNDEAGLLDRDYISGSSGTYQTVITELDPFIGIAYLHATIYETSPTLREIGTDMAIYVESDDATITLTGTGYVGSTAYINYVQAPTGSWIRLVDETTSRDIQTWTGVYGNGQETYIIPVDAYGHTYEATLYSASDVALDSATLTVQGTTTNTSSMHTLSGKVYDSETGGALYVATISGGGRTTQTNNVGSYSLLMTGGVTNTTCSRTGYTSRSLDIYMAKDEVQDWYLSPENPSTTGNASIYGTVIDPSTGQPVSGATVTVTDEDGNTKTVATSDTGYYEISGLEDEEYDIKISKDGYDTVTETVTADGETGHDADLVDSDATSTVTHPSETSEDANNDGVPDDQQDTDGDGISDSDDTTSARPGRVAAQDSLVWFEDTIPKLIQLVVVLLIYAMFKRM